ncbi:MerR family transcriptional regulator [Pseudonocardia lacus]|jgi:DNA-binding transcriptional MerR regulator|uniref:MerR family transcriptional regulator n=1 Tax=Pseudonocardia lacus TaxID=2835865 RepID=UPI001BDD72F9|nr:MerR family transcriptional regulator [Pseudonocardia lacus]
MTSDGWTIGELAARVAAALGDGYPGAPDSRVRAVPDARAIRWYATIGLVDRPSAMRGRTALYGTRHLLQLVAVKRRQAQGRSIAEIQRELAGAGDAALREIAELPDDLPTTGDADAPVVEPTARPARFWTARPAAAAPGPEPEPPALLTGVPLGGGAVLLLPAAPDPDDLHAITATAGPLLDLLSARGLLRSAP